MQRLVAYLYEYEKGVQVRNAGFVKVIQEREKLVAVVHGKGLHVREKGELIPCFFRMHDEKLTRIWRPAILANNPTLNCRIEFCPENEGEMKDLQEIRGLILYYEGNPAYAASWDGFVVKMESIMESSEEQHEDLVETMECTEEISPYIDYPSMQVEKISREALACLARKEWRLANNSFLLHGYYNYHHLVFVEDDGVTKLGVPGIYHPQEARAAEAFGFTEFVRVQTEDLELTKEEKEEGSDFGYWCRQVHRIRV